MDKGCSVLVPHRSEKHSQNGYCILHALHTTKVLLRFQGFKRLSPLIWPLLNKGYQQSRRTYSAMSRLHSQVH
jgi:hypothetical protein